MKKGLVLAAVLVAYAVQPGWAADKPTDKADKPADKVVASKAATKTSCPPASAREAEQAIRYLTDLMVVSSTCQDTVYAEFRLRNRDVIVNYQKAMIHHLRGNANFDRWNTALANQVAQKQGGNMQLCAQSVALLQQAKGLDAKGFRAFATAQAATANPSCAK
jgi:hypothetical protein